jgi:hypothetical protein
VVEAAGVEPSPAPRTRWPTATGKAPEQFVGGAAKPPEAGSRRPGRAVGSRAEAPPLRQECAGWRRWRLRKGTVRRSDALHRPCASMSYVKFLADPDIDCPVVGADAEAVA